MDDFEKVEARLRHMNIKAPDYGNAYGALALDGEDSTIKLTGNLPLSGAASPTGFDLRLECADGRSVFVHNAVHMSMEMSADRGSRSATLFPNMLVDNAAAIDANGQCQSIRFELDGWNALFAYNFFEPLDVIGEVPPPLKAELAAARYDFTEGEPFVPHQIFVANDLGTLVDFEVDGRRYSIYSGCSQKFGSRDQLYARVRLIGTISFPEPVDLEIATDACWNWRCYFNQMTMRPLAFRGMSVSRTTDPTTSSGNLYLPYVRSQHRLLGDRQVEPFYMPLNRWSERATAAEAMRDWLTKQDERRVFRAALDRVLARPGHIAMEDAVALCAGVDTLAELSSKSEIPKKVLQDMAEAAVAAATAASIDVDLNRVRGLLGALQNEDLARRLMRMAAIGAPEANQQDVALWLKTITPLRLYGAHGRKPASDDTLVASPAVEALAALCARYDLRQAGIPSKTAQGYSTQPTRQWERALLELRTFKPHALPATSLQV